MKYFLSVVLFILVVIIQVIYACHMKKVATLKGYGDDSHAWAMCFWLGILGGLYVAALPDLIQQSQNQQILDVIKGRSKE